jgi:ABC-type lipoprotein release transport system permease subunit
MAAGLMIAAAVVLVLKIHVIVQLTMLAIEIAQAIATAGPTLGASPAEIPIFKELTGFVIDILIDQAIGALLGG